MRRSLPRLPSCTIPISSAATKHPFSTSSSGRGRGRGLSNDFSNNFGIAPGSKPDSSSSEQPPQPQPPLGHGRGKPLPSFTPFVNPQPPVSAGRGRGSGHIFTPSAPAKPSFDSASELTPPPPPPPPLANNRSTSSQNPEETNIPSSILSVLTGAGRGRPMTPPEEVSDKAKQVENRHIRRPQQVQGPSTRGGSPSPPRERLSQEEARKKAVGILSRGDDRGGAPAVDGGGDARGGRGGFRGRGGRGRGMFGGRGRGRGRGGRGEGRGADRDDDFATGLYLGDNADGEKLAKKLGPDMMNKLVEAFEEMSSTVLPSPAEDVYLDALHTNMMIECEPEYMVEFGNPDLDEKPPISLREYLEKMKPYIMALENIESHEEWEEVMKETMERVPLMKEIVDYYSGPDRVSAKKQQEELERVAKTLPESAPASVKQYTDRALLSLQSNPGWGFDKKCQFMDKLVWEVSQQYK